MEQPQLKHFHRAAALLLGALMTLLAGCTNDFDSGAVANGVAQRELQLDSEQVALSPSQVACGVQSELWDAGSAGLLEQTVYRLTPKARELNFSDDIYVNDPAFPSAYTQLRGKFKLQSGSMVNATAESPSQKLVQVQLGVRINHPCFTTPLPIMGIKKGKFTSEVAPLIRFENTADGWYPTELAH